MGELSRLPLISRFNLQFVALGLKLGAAVIARPAKLLIQLLANLENFHMLLLSNSFAPSSVPRS
jgi:hypothetical protein